MSRRRFAVLVSLVLSCAPSVSGAAAVNLAWTRCFGEGAPETIHSFACDTNAGSERIACSFVLDADLAQVTGVEITIDLISQDSPLPNWWGIHGASVCRPGALTMSLREDDADVVCHDWSGGASVGGVASYGPTSNFPPAVEAHHAQLLAAAAVPPGSEPSLVSLQEYFCGYFEISNVQTVGADNCAGCTDPVCLVFTKLKVDTPGGTNDVTIYGTTGSSAIRWQAVGADCAAVPVRNRTWGALKSMYR